MLSKLLKLAGNMDFSGVKDTFAELDLKNFAKKFHEDETGQGMTEYIIIIVLVAILVIVVVKLFGKKIKALFKGSTDKLGEAGSEAGIDGGGN